MISYFDIKPQILSSYIKTEVRKLCKDCKRYGKSASCPPNINSINYYKNLIESFNCGKLVAIKFEITTPKDWETLGNISSKVLVGILKSYANENIKDRHLFLGAGSCKVCNSCKIPCVNEHQVISIEAAGVDVINLLAYEYNLHLNFPVEEIGYFYRVGALLYDKY